MLGTVSLTARGETHTFALARRQSDGVLCAVANGTVAPFNRQDKVSKSLAAAQADSPT
jgi:hypothetical protein